MFIDRVRLRVRAGDGGAGAISFRREAHVPRGGPDGGDGGRGGDVVVRVDPSVTTLSELRFLRKLEATDGRSGAGKKRSGKGGDDAVVRVPPGTVVSDLAAGEVVADLIEPGEELVLARGGRGGKGNARFATSVRRAPRIAEDGGRGEEREVELELKLLADVGLVGLPNAGKSTLLAALTRARPKIADYPFTTLSPNLGVARLEDRELVVADIPGLIEGAHQGAGLGEEFLRHIERTRLLVHVVDVARDEPESDLRIVEGELREYGKGLLQLPRLVALNKLDLAEPDRVADIAARLSSEADSPHEDDCLPRPVLALSAATGGGVTELKKELFARCPPRPVAAAHAPAERRIAFAGSAKEWRVRRDGRTFTVSGERFERLAAGIDWESPDASAYFHRLLARSGVERELRAQGAREGDTVRIGGMELEWTDLPER